MSEKNTPKNSSPHNNKNEDKDDVSNKSKRVSKNSNLPNLNNPTNLEFPDSGVSNHPALININNTDVPKSSDASTSLKAANIDEDIQEKHVGFEEVYPHRTSPLITQRIPHQDSIGESPFRSSNNICRASNTGHTDGTTGVDISDVNRAMERSVKASIESHDVANVNRMKLADTHAKPKESTEMRQTRISLDNYTQGTSATPVPHEGLVITVQSMERVTVKPEDTVCLALSEQTLYTRAAKKLPVSGPLSIKDLDNFLKKAKLDFDHFYNKKPISNLKIPDFNLLKTLGVGAFGKVVLGEYKKDKTLYALKIIEKVGVVKRNQVRYVSNEKRILQSMNFPFVVDLKYFFTDYYYLYFVMPYIPGGNFYRHLKAVHKVKETEARFYIGQLILALEYIHYLELIHRDIKTENVMMDAFGYLKLVDFGQCIRCSSGDKTLTFTGTPDYMAPEILVGKGYDCAVDWWALGIIIFEVCAGFRPFKNENNHKLQMLILCNQYTLPSSFSRSLKKIVESLLVLEPKKRIANNTKKAFLLKKHEWFKGLDWSALLNRTLEAPYLPDFQKLSQNHPT